MAGNTVFKLRRSSVAGKVPNTSTLSIGELALNLTDRKLYSSDGTDVWETGANLTTLEVSTNTATFGNAVFINSNGSVNITDSLQVSSDSSSNVVIDTSVDTGLSAYSNDGYAIIGTSTTNGSIGVWGMSVDGTAVRGESPYGVGGRFVATSANAVPLVAANATANVFVVNYNGNINISGSFLPSSDNAYDLGSSTFRWANVYTGTVNGAVYSVGTSFIANSTGVYHTGVVNAISYNVGNTTTGTGGQFSNATVLTIGNNTINTRITSAGLIVNGQSIANNTGFYTSGTVNALSATIGTSSNFRANTTHIVFDGPTISAINASMTVNNMTVNTNLVVISNTTLNVLSVSSNTSVNNVIVTGGIYANGEFGTAGQVLTTNGSTLYWATDADYSTNTDAQYIWTNTHTFVQTIDGTANSSLYIGSLPAANVVSDIQLQSNLANYLPTYTGTVNAASYTVGTSFTANSTVTNTVSLVVSSNTSVNNVLISGGIYANGSFGTAGHVLHSNGTATYWAVDDNSGTVTSVATGNGLTGGTITSSGTVSVLANNGIFANATGLYVIAGTGTVVNATGVHVNATYIGTLSANNASFLGGTAAASYQLNSTLNANIANYLPTYTGTVNGAVYSVGTSFIANSTGVYHTGLVNAASYTVGTSFTANSTVTNTVSLVVSTNTATFGNAVFINSNGSVNITDSLQVSSDSSSNVVIDTSIDTGVSAYSNTGYGIIGTSNANGSIGVFGMSVDGTAVRGESPYGVAGRFVATSSNAVPLVVSNATSNVFIINYSGNVTISGSVLPIADSTYNLGSPSYRWSNVYTGDLHLSNEGTKGNEIDGTTGTWIIQEGKENIYIINKKTNKKYKFNLTEVD